MPNKSALQRQHASWPSSGCQVTSLCLRLHVSTQQFSNGHMCSSCILLYVSRPSAWHEHRVADTPWKICMHAQWARAGFPYAWCPHRRCCSSIATKSLFATSVWTVLKSQQDKISRKKILNDTWHPLSLVNKQDQTKPRQNFKSYLKCRTGTH